MATATVPFRSLERPSSPAPRCSVWRSWRREPSCVTPASPDRSSSSPRPRPTSSRTSSRSTWRPPCTRPAGVAALAAAAVSRSAQRREPGPGPPQGRHRHAPRRRAADRGGAAGEGDPRCTWPRAGVGLDALRGRRRAGQRVHGPPARPARRHPRRPGRRRHRAPVASRRQLRCDDRPSSCPAGPGALRHRRLRAPAQPRAPPAACRSGLRSRSSPPHRT